MKNMKKSLGQQVEVGEKQEKLEWLTWLYWL